MTRSSTCGSLGLPPDLCCFKCEPNITRALQKGIKPRNIKQCIQPWLSKWSNHNEINKVRVYKEVNLFLGRGDEEADILIETYLYDKLNTNNETIDNNDELCNGISLRNDTIIPPSPLSPPSPSNEPNNIHRETLEFQSQYESETRTDSYQDQTSRYVSDNGVHLKQQICRSNKQNINVTVPSSHKLVDASHLARLESKAENYDKLMK